jgi:hypothetical protein
MLLSDWVFIPDRLRDSLSIQLARGMLLAYLTPDPPPFPMQIFMSFFRAFKGTIPRKSV